jgi:disulfide bond formation protein DsbB
MPAMLAFPASSYRTFGLAAAVVAGIALGGALASERWVGLVPCPLCLISAFAAHPSF